MTEQRYTKKERDLAKSVNLFQYLRDSGYEMQKSGREYQLRDHDSFKITEDGKWYWHSRSMGDISPIDAVKELEGIGVIETVKKLAAYAGHQGQPPSQEDRTRINVPKKTKAATEVTKQQEPKEFILPERNTNDKRAYAYLVQERKIDPEIVIACMKQGLIYESRKYHNVVFIGQKDDNGSVKFASLRGTYTNAEKPPFRGDVTGSDKQYSFALSGTNNILYVFESPVDALSHATVNKIGGLNWQEDHRISLGSLSEDALVRYLEKHNEIKEIYFALDNDIDGRKPDGTPCNWGQKAAAKYAAKYSEQGYKTSILTPDHKDVNEDLQEIMATKEKNTVSFDKVGADQTQQKNLEAVELSGVEASIQRLREGVPAVFSSEKYLNYLKVMSKFHHYSYRNCLLIAMARPDATLVAGFVAWKDKFGRTVKKGEKGIRILQPVTKNKEVEKIDRETGEITKEIEDVKTGWKNATVFDISQTEGKELPKLVSELAGTKEGIADILTAIKNIAPVPVYIKAIASGAKGYFSESKGEIAIREGMSDIQTLKTAIHELAHARLHVSTAESAKETRSAAEVQAESVAFCVSNHFGIDTSDYSFPYIASWGSGRDIEELKASLKVIRKTSHAIIQEMKSELEKIAEREIAAPSEQSKLAEKEKANEQDITMDREEMIRRIIEDTLKHEPEFPVKALEAMKDDYRKAPIENLRKAYYFYFHNENLDAIRNLYIMDPKATPFSKMFLKENAVIKRAISTSESSQKFRQLVKDQIKRFNEIKENVKVQVVWCSDLDVFKNGDLFSLKEANSLFKKQEQLSANSDQEWNHLKFALYIQDAEGKCKYGEARYDFGSGQAKDLMDYISKNTSSEISTICKNEMQKTCEAPTKNHTQKDRDQRAI